MASPRRIPAAAGSDSLPLMENGDKENICQDRNIVTDCPTLHREGAVSTKRKKKPGGFNLRKSIAWNPAFFTEEGVLDNTELSVLSGSQMKPNRNPGSGIGGTISPLCRFGRSGSASVQEAAENSRGKLLVKYRSPENKGRKLFSPAKSSERDEQREVLGKQDKRSARSIQNSIPRSPTGYAQKKVPNSNATTQMSRTPKKSFQPSIPMVPRSTSSATNISKSNTKLPPAKTDHPSRMEALQLKSKIKPTPLTKSYRPTTEKDVAPVVTAIHGEGNSSRKCASYSTNLQNRPSSSVGVPTSTNAKPSALRMPSPSVGFFSQEKALVSHEDAAQGITKSCFTRNTSSLAKPPRYKQSENVNSRLSQAPVSNGDTAQGNTKICFTRNTSALAKPPRYKQPEDLKSRLCLTAQLPTNGLANSEPLVHPVMNTLASSLPGLEHDNNVCSEKESLSEGITTCLAKSRNASNEPTRMVDCFSAGSGATTRSPGSEKNGGSRNGVPNAYIVASHVEERGIINRTEPNENSHSLKSICSSTIEHVEDSCSDEAISSSMKPIAASKLSSSCISEVCTLDDFICESKPENRASVAIDLENSLAGQKMVSVSLSEGNSCTPGSDFLRDFDSYNLQHTECSTRKSVECTTCADRVPQCGNSIDIKPTSADATTDLRGSFCNEAKPNSSEEANTDGAVDFDSNSPLTGKEVQLLVGCGCDHDYRSTECSPTESAAPVPCADFSDLKEVTVDCRTETHDSLAVERQPLLLEEPNTEDDMDIDSDSPLVGKEVQLSIGSEYDHDYSTECSPMELGTPVPCIDFSDSKEVAGDCNCKTETHDSLPVERQLVLLEEANTEHDMKLDTNAFSILEDPSPIGKNKAVHISGTNTIIKNHLKQLVPFSEEWLAAMEACGEEVLEQKSGAVQNSPTDKTTPEPSPWSPVKRKAQDVGPFDCTKYSKGVRTTDTP